MIFVLLGVIDLGESLMARCNAILVRQLFVVFFLCGFVPQLFANSVGASVGVHGIAIDYTWQLNPSLDVRFALTDMPFNDELKVDGITYDLEYERTNLAVLIDIMPWQNGFHVTGGLFVLDHQWQINSKLNGRYYIGDSNYQADNLKLSGDITYAAASPYLGVGWKNIFGKNGHWSMTAEAGILYVGEPSVDYDAVGKVSADGTNWVDASSDPDFQKSLAEEETQLEKKLEDFEFWPVLQLGVNYKF